MSPTASKSEGCCFALHSSLRCNRPLVFKPKSMKAPKSTTLCTVPFTTVPTLISSRLTTCLRVRGAGKSSRGSRPGLARAAMISRTVGIPASSLCAILSTSTNGNLTCNASSWDLSCKSFNVKPSSPMIRSANS